MQSLQGFAIAGGWHLHDARHDQITVSLVYQVAASIYLAVGFAVWLTNGRL